MIGIIVQVFLRFTAEKSTLSCSLALFATQPTALALISGNACMI